MGVIPAKNAPLSYNAGATHRHGSFPGGTVIADSRICEHVRSSERYYKESKEKHHPLSRPSNSITGSSILMYFHLVIFSVIFSVVVIT